MRTIRDLTTTFSQAGRLEWIGLTPVARGPMEAVQEAHLEIDRGLTGDHHAKRRKSSRQVTIIQFEHLPVVAALCGLEKVPPELLRRNLAVAGVNVLALKDQTFRIGETVLQGTGPCAPCSRMESTLGIGGYNAVRGHGGVTARVLVGGMIRLGDVVEPAEAPPLA